ncbi:carboxypeptidase regulatory-like domain-containing protein [Algoriphagus mannitolivorans]|uniref:carboxypeptidase regulatory-like domain-containing protein n=1 Tax=Algoriphagus mannitolivorans TaxID=226504 RepID=UPI0004152C71|nr:carboxypeptidase regulatory-like domain-containing protein [Algoriphagus mannitolivorans]
MKRIALVAWFLGTFFSLQAQNGRIVGKVEDQKTGAPLAELHVFIPNTTYQAFTDSLGNFMILGVPEGKWNIQARSFGYQDFSEFIVVKGIQELKISLTHLDNFSPKPEYLNGKGREKLLDQVMVDFVGRDFKKQEIGLLNPDKVIFETQADKSVRVSSAGPLFFSNNWTYYLVTVYFEPYILGSGSQLIITPTYFELPEQVGTEEAKKRNRLAIYQKTPNFFLASLMEGKTDFTKNNPNPSVSMGENPGEYYLEFNQPTQISAGGFQGEIGYQGDKLALHLDGSPIRPDELVLGGDFSEYNPIFGIPSNFNADRLIKLANLEKSPQAMEEQVYLHTDRSSYWKGEQVYFKSYVAYGSPLLQEELSKVLHLELVDSTGYLWQHELVEIKSGIASGYFTLPADFTGSGSFFLKAYTAWSKNYPKGTFVQPIQILDPRDETFGSIPEDISQGVMVFSEKQIYQAGEKVKLNVMVQDENGRPLASNLSVSVVDLNQTGFIPEIEPISDAMALQFSSLEPKEFEFPLEKGIVLHGQLLDDRGAPVEGNLKAFINGYEDIRAFGTGLDGKFQMPPSSFQGEFEINVQATDKKGQPIRNVSLEVKNYQDSWIPKQYQFPEIVPRKVKSPSIPMGPLQEGEILLEEAVIEEKREASIGPMIYGRPHKVVETKDLFLNGSTIQFLYALVGQVPGMQVSGTPPNVSIRFRSGEPLILVNGNPVNAVSGLTLAGGGSSGAYNALEGINVFNIERVEVIRGLVPQYGDQGRNGIISIFLKSGAEQAKNLNNYTLFKFKGFSEYLPFLEAEKYREEKPWLKPFRPTLLWRPNLVTDPSSLLTSLEFELNDPTGPILVEIRGISDLGKPLMGRFVLNKPTGQEN